MKRILFIALLAVICMVAFSERIIHVNKNATALPIDGSSWNNAYRSLRAALQEARSGDTLYVSAHTYQENNLSMRDEVTIIGGFIAGANEPSGITKINGGNAAGHPALIFGDYAHIENLEIHNSYTAVHAERVMAYRIKNCYFTNNVTGVFLKDTDQRAYHLPFEAGVIEKSSFTNNSYAITGFNDYSDIKNNYFSDNSSYSVYFKSQSQSQIFNNIFENEENSVQAEYSDTRIFSNKFNNISYAAIQLLNHDRSHIYNNIIESSDIGVKLNQDQGKVFNNHLKNNYYAVYGENYASSRVGENNIFTDNQVSIFTSDATLRVSGNDFSGADIDFELVDSNNRIYANTVKDNQYYVGRLTGRENSIYNNFIHNSNNLFYFDAAAVNFFNNTIVRYDEGLHFRSVDAVKPAYIYNNIFWVPSHSDVANVSLENSPSVTISHNMYQNEAPDEDDHPIRETIDSPFRNTDKGDYTLHKESEAIDAGKDNLRVDFSVVKDKAGNSRWQFTRPENLPPDQAVLTDDINIIDLGAYEYQSPLPEFTEYIEMKKERDPSIQPVNWEAGSTATYDGLHHIELEEITNNISYLKTYFPKDTSLYDPHMFLNMAGNTFDAGWHRILVFRLYSPVTREEALQFYFYDEEDTHYSTSFIDLQKGWNVIKLNMAELDEEWAHKKIGRFRFDFAFTDLITRKHGVTDEDFEFEFKLDWVKLYPDRARTSVEQSQWNLYH